MEVYISEILGKNAWAVLEGVTYYDDNTKTNREIDLTADKFDKDTSWINNCLIIECKKSEGKPWLFIKRKYFKADAFNFNVASPNIDGVYSFFSKHASKLRYSTSAKCTHNIWLYGRGENEIYKAINQVTTALLFHYDSELKYHKKYKNSHTTILYPIIVLDGELLSAKIEGNDIEVSEESHLQYLFNRSLDEPAEFEWGNNSVRIVRNKPFIIDIVKKEYFEEFIKKFGTIQNNITN